MKKTENSLSVIFAILIVSINLSLFSMTEEQKNFTRRVDLTMQTNFFLIAFASADAEKEPYNGIGTKHILSTYKETLELIKNPLYKNSTKNLSIAKIEDTIRILQCQNMCKKTPCTFLKPLKLNRSFSV